MPTSITEPEKLESLRNYEAEAARDRIMQQILSAPPAGPMPPEPPKPPTDTRTVHEIELAKRPMEVHHPRIPFNPYPDKLITTQHENAAAAPAQDESTRGVQAEINAPASLPIHFDVGPIVRSQVEVIKAQKELIDQLQSEIRDVRAMYHKSQRRRK